jgi:glycosyltransferase involved in cell wall biosynthesis
MPELVSILIPAYNAERWLHQTVRSCLAQTWPRCEIVIVDDGSTDRTLEIARTFACGSIKVVTQPNGGAAAARNAAFALAQGSFIQWLDADDLLDAEKIARQMAVAREVSDPRIALSGRFGTFYHRPEKATFVRTSLWRDLTPLEYFLIRFNENVYFQTDAWLVSRELTEATGPWSDDSPDDDGEYFCRLIARSGGIKFVDGARTYYRSGLETSLHVKRSKKALDALFLSKAKCIRYLLSLEESARTRRASIQLLQDWLPYFHPEHPDLVERVRHMARELGGELSLPRLKWKYRPIEWLFGPPSAATLSRTFPILKSRIAAEWDRSLQAFASSKHHFVDPARHAANDDSPGHPSCVRE